MISDKNLAHFCSGNLTWHAPSHSGNFNVYYLTSDVLRLEPGIATGPVNGATFESAGPRAGILKLEITTFP